MFLLVGCAALAAVGVGRADTVEQVRWEPVVVSGVMGFVVTVVWGALLGAGSRWQEAKASLLAAMVTLLGLYVLAMLLGPNGDDPAEDDAAGAGVALLAVPLGGALAIALGVGVGLSGLVRMLWPRQR